MAAAKLAKKAQEALAVNRKAANDLAQGAGQKRVLALLKKAQRDLERRIDDHPLLAYADEEEPFTIAQMRATLAQLRLVTRQVAVDMKPALVDTAREAAEMGAQDTIDYLNTADKAFRGVGTQPLALREAEMLDAAVQGSNSSLLARIAGEEGHAARPGILQRYGVETIRTFEQKLQSGFLQKKSWGEMADDLTDGNAFLSGKPRSWAERIVRTEAMGAYNRANYEAVREADEDLEDMVKILSATFDERTGSDSIAVHGQIRRPEEPFETWFGAMQHPPNRPNDREIVVPHRVAWPIPKYLEWRPWEEVTKRWALEGHKDRPPERPEMTTVPLSQFGREPEPKRVRGRGDDED